MQSQQSAVDVAAKSARRVRPGRILFVVSPAQVAPGPERRPASARKARSRGAWLVFSLGLVLSPAVGQAQIVEWAVSAGGAALDAAHGVAVDAAGNSYVTGGFEGTATFGPFALTSAGPRDIFVAKYDGSGNVLWASSAGGLDFDEGNSIAVDAVGNSYVMGAIVGTATFGPLTVASAGSRDIFVAKYDTAGNVLWARSAGGTSLDLARAIAVDAAGNSYVTGSFSTPASFGPFVLTAVGHSDAIFVAKYDSSGNVLWARSAGTVDFSDLGTAIAVDATGNSYVTGRFQGTMTFGAFALTSAGDWDIFVAKYDAVGNALWARSDGGTLFDEGFGIGVDGAGNSYVTGRFRDTATFGPFMLTDTGFWDAFVAKYDPSGNVLWARSAGGTDLDRGYGIAVDAGGNSFVTGFNFGTATFGPFTLSGGGLFVAEYDSTGNVLWARSAAGTGYSDLGNAIAVDARGNSYVTGRYPGTATFGSFTLTSAGDDDIFVAKYNTCGNGSIDPDEACDGGLACTDCLCGAGFEPMTPPSTNCRPICGNGNINPGEECDGGSGCTACLCGAGFEPMIPPSLNCRATCGTGVCGPGQDSCNCPDDCGAPSPNEIPGPSCTDGLDNDCDSLIDSNDPDCSAIPTVSQWGLIVLALLLLTGGKVCFGRKWALRAHV